MKKIRLTNEQAEWLFDLLTKGHDIYFEKNKRSRRINDEIVERLKCI